MRQEEIKKAVEEKRAVLCWRRQNWQNIARLVICETSEDAAKMAAIDTRGQCFNAWDEVWCEIAPDTETACKAARGELYVCWWNMRH